jgi:hypothetical protein
MLIEDNRSKRHRKRSIKVKGYGVEEIAKEDCKCGCSQNQSPCPKKGTAHIAWRTTPQETYQGYLLVSLQEGGAIFLWSW